MLHAADRIILETSDFIRSVYGVHDAAVETPPHLDFAAVARMMQSDTRHSRRWRAERPAARRAGDHSFESEVEAMSAPGPPYGLC